jgi:hypothetical protein
MFGRGSVRCSLGPLSSYTKPLQCNADQCFYSVHAFLHNAFSPYSSQIIVFHHDPCGLTINIRLWKATQGKGNFYYAPNFSSNLSCKLIRTIFRSSPSPPSLKDTLQGFYYVPNFHNFPITTQHSLQCNLSPSLTICPFYNSDHITSFSCFGINPSLYGIALVHSRLITLGTIEDMNLKQNTQIQQLLQAHILMHLSMQ